MFSSAGHTESPGNVKQTDQEEPFEVLQLRLDLLQGEIANAARLAPSCGHRDTHTTQQDDGKDGGNDGFNSVPSVDSLRSRMQKLSDSVNQLSEVVNDENHQYSVDYLQGYSNWKDFRAYCETLIDLAHLFAILLEFRDHLQHDRFVKCATDLLECEELLHKFDKEYENDLVSGTFEAAKFLLSQHKVGLRESARSAFRRLVQVYSSGHELEEYIGIKAGTTPCILVDELGHCNQQASPVNISEFVIALKATGALEEELQHASEQVVKNFVHRIVEGRIVCHNLSTSDTRWNDEATRRLLVSKASTDSSSNLAKSIQEQLYILLRYLCTTIISLSSDTQADLPESLQVQHSYLGNILWWGVQKATVSPPWLNSCFPSRESIGFILFWSVLNALPNEVIEGPESAQAMSDEFAKLEHSLVSSKFISADTWMQNCPHWIKDLLQKVTVAKYTSNAKLCGLLGTISGDIPAIHCYKFRSTYLVKGRNICAQEYHNSQRIEFQEAVNSDKIFPFPICHVSQTAIGLEQLVDQIMSKLVSLSKGDDHIVQGSLKDRLSRTLLMAARDSFDIFRTVVSTKFSDAISESPRLSMLFHNDCLYLSNRALVIGFKYREKLVEPYSSLTLFVDMVPLLRDAAERTYCNQLRIARERIHEDLDQLPCLSDLNDSDAYSQMDNVIKNCVRKINHFVRDLGNVLPFPLHVQTTAHLLDTALLRLLKAVLQMNVIPSGLKWTLTELLEELKDSIAIERVADANDDSESITLYDSSQYLRKTELLIMFVKAGKDDLMREENKKEFQKFFVESELVKLIHSCYCDSPELRKELIDIFTSTS